MYLPQPIQHFVNWFSTPDEGPKGIRGLADPRFYICLFCYFIAFIFFVRDPFFQKEGVFEYQQGIATLVIAFSVCAALNWELCIFGKPGGANLFLHLLQFFPMALLLARILGGPSTSILPSSWLDHAMEIGQKAWNTMMGKERFLPEWLTDLFRNWRISLYGVLTLFTLCLKNLRFKIAALLLWLLIPLFSCVEQGGMLWLFCGLPFLAAGMALQFCRYDHIVFYNNILRILNRSHNAMDKMLLETIGRTMVQLHERGSMSGNTFVGIVKASYMPDGVEDTAMLKYYAHDILQRLLADGLVELQSDATGDRIFPAPQLRLQPNNLLAQVAVVPRVILLLLTALLWIVMPIDLLPDAIPFFGMLDDVGVAILSGAALKNAIEHREVQT